MGIADYNTSASLNTTIGGIYVGPNPNRSDMDNAFRQIMADLASFHEDPTGALGGILDHVVYATDAPFNAVGDGVADDTAALSAFWNHAIGNPGIPHYLGNKRYKITAALPTINISNVWIEGCGSDIHDIGTTLATGSVIVWGGATSPAVKMATISSVSGASNQRIANITFKGIGFDCNSGGVGYALECLSVMRSHIDVTVANASQKGVVFDVVPTLGETKDNQQNFIRIRGRQVEASGYSLQLSGDGVANTSMNDIYADLQHKDGAAILCTNSDNNDWRFVRCFKVSGGSATESISLMGSNTAGANCRAERFWFLSTNTPLHAYGTSGPYASTYPVTSVQVFSLDRENGTPTPIVEAGAFVSFRDDDSDLDDSPWKSYTPTISASSGSLTTVTSVSGYWRKFGKKVEFKVGFEITTNGTGSGTLKATLPVSSVGSTGQICTGKERASTGKTMSGFIDSASTDVVMQFYDGTYPGMNGGIYNISGQYECGS